MIYKLTQKGFIFISDTMNRLYYYNPITNIKQWHPHNLEYTVNLPENWKIKESSNKNIFFYNTQTKNGQYNIPIEIDSTKFYKILKGEHGELKTDGKIVCKTEECPAKCSKQKGYKIFNLMYLLNNMDICPRPLSINVTNHNIEICMEHGGIDFDERIPDSEKYYLESSLNKLGELLSKTNLIFVDLCLQFNPGNIVYNKISKKVMLIDIDLNWIRLGLDIPDNYWKDILEVYKNYTFREADEEYDDDPSDIFSNQLKQINNKYLKYITLSQGLSSVNISEDDIRGSLFAKNFPIENQLFQGKLQKDLFQGIFNVKGYYNTKTPELTF